MVTKENTQTHKKKQIINHQVTDPLCRIFCAMLWVCFEGRGLITLKRKRHYEKWKQWIYYKKLMIENRKYQQQKTKQKQILNALALWRISACHSLA